MKWKVHDLQIWTIDERDNYGISIWQLCGYLEIAMSFSLNINKD